VIRPVCICTGKPNFSTISSITAHPIVYINHQSPDMKALITLLLFTIAGRSHAQMLNFAWVKQMGGTGEANYMDMAVDASGSVYVTGYFTGTVDFDPGAGVLDLTSNGGQDIFVCKLDQNGNFIWVKQIGSTGRDRGTSIALDAANNI